VRGDSTPAPGEQHGSPLTTINSSLTAARPAVPTASSRASSSLAEGSRRSCMGARQSGRFECSTEFDEQQRRSFEFCFSTNASAVRAQI
jgi:hypothetical protein